MTRFALIGCVLIAITAPSLAHGQKIQQLEGLYLGLANEASFTGDLSGLVQLSIDDQDQRRFSGTLLFIEQDNLNVSGTIAASDTCKIVTADGGDNTTLLVRWMNFGGGAAMLGGDVNGDGVKGANAVAFLRPFDRLAIDWREAIGTQKATFASALDGSITGATVAMDDGIVGLFSALVVMDDFIRLDHALIGTTDDQGNFAAAGILAGQGPGGSGVVQLSGQVKINERGQPVAIAGNYLIETSAGKLIDVGTFNIDIIVGAGP